KARRAAGRAAQDEGALDVELIDAVVGGGVAGDEVDGVGAVGDLQRPGAQAIRLHVGERVVALVGDEVALAVGGVGQVPAVGQAVALVAEVRGGVGDVAGRPGSLGRLKVDLDSN